MHFSGYYKIYSWIMLANSNLDAGHNCELAVTESCFVLLLCAHFGSAWVDRLAAQGCLDCADSRGVSVLPILYMKKNCSHSQHVVLGQLFHVTFSSHITIISLF